MSKGRTIPVKESKISVIIQNVTDDINLTAIISSF